MLLANSRKLDITINRFCRITKKSGDNYKRDNTRGKSIPKNVNYADLISIFKYAQ